MLCPHLTSNCLAFYGVFDKPFRIANRKLIMELSPLYQQRLEAATQQGIKQGISQGVSQGLQLGKRLLIENFLQFRFGELDEELSAVIEALLDIPVEEVPPFAIDFSREELIARFIN
jgi:flagellar biosynthesis/type III secretory pathway protein FliH